MGNNNNLLKGKHYGSPILPVAPMCDGLLRPHIIPILTLQNYSDIVGKSIAR